MQTSIVVSYLQLYLEMNEKVEQEENIYPAPIRAISPAKTYLYYGFYPMIF